MDLDYALLADGVQATSDQKLNIFGAGFDTILAPDVPARHPQLSLAIRLLVSRNELEHEHSLQVVIQAMDGDEIARAETSLPAMPEPEREQIPAGRQVGVAAVLNFAGLIFPTYGTYQLVLLWDGTEVRSPLRLFVERPPAEA